MTLIEFYSERQLENIISAIYLNPSKIIFVGYENDIPQNKKEVIRRYFKIKKINVSIEFVNIKKHCFKCAVGVLSDICEKNPDCVVDFTGGEETVLAAMGFVMAKYNVRAVEMNINKKLFYKDLQEGSEPVLVNPENSIHENFILHGGVIDRNKMKPEKEQLKNGVEKEVFALWDICKTNNQLWNTNCGIIKSIANYEFPKSNVNSIFNKLVEKKFINIDKETRSVYKISYKNKITEVCLKDPGVILELYIYYILKNSGKFNDVNMGVTVDWDGVIHCHSEKAKDTSNEIDVVAMNGIIPVYISCKNGKVSKETLYELETVGERFGDIYSVKILVAPAVDKNNISDKYLINRANDMGITIISDVDDISADVMVSRIFRQSNLNIESFVVS